MVVNTPTGRDARADGYAIRAATTSMDKPIITTVQQLGAAVQGIESQMTEKVRVKLAAGPRPGPRPVLPQGRPLVTVERRERHRPRRPR